MQLALSSLVLGLDASALAEAMWSHRQPWPLLPFELRDTQGHRLYLCPFETDLGQTWSGQLENQ